MPCLTYIQGTAGMEHGRVEVGSLMGKMESTWLRQGRWLSQGHIGEWQREGGNQAWLT